MLYVRVRLAMLADAPSVAIVHVGSWRSTYRGLVPEEYLDGLSVDRRRKAWEQLIAEASEDRGVLVLEDNDTVVGFCHFSPTRDDDAGPAAGEVTAIDLLASHWRRGGGSLLLVQAVQALTNAGFHRATLWVLDSNDRARRFYENHGWHPDGSIKVDDRGTFQLCELRYARLL